MGRLLTALHPRRWWRRPVARAPHPSLRDAAGAGHQPGDQRDGRVAELSYRQLDWATTSYLRDETLTPAITALVNYSHRLPLTQTWGDGTLSSSDGQRFPVRVKAATATPLPRYFGTGRGLTFYTWTSDQFSQYGSRVISSTVRDATYVLDAILDNETELEILEHTTDTDGYTDLVFGLFDLLGLQFAPRIRDLGAQRLYRLGPVNGYQHAARCSKPRSTVGGSSSAGMTYCALLGR